jgi:rhodanese-related sulfurtransferase/DNA-binding transcriptional ArsR family regulator
MNAMSTFDVKAELFEQLARIGKALGSAYRLQLLDLLAQGERSVDVLAQLCRLSVTNASQHLQHLRRAGLVRARKEGLYVHYRLSGEGVVRLVAAMRAVGEEHVAEVDKLVKEYLNTRDEFEAVPARELLERSRKGLVTILDVRPPEEYAAGHLPGAINIPLPDVAKRAKELPANREVVAYCRGPYCLMSFEAVALLRKKGRKARRLQDGYPEWKLLGLPVEQGPPGAR